MSSSHTYRLLHLRHRCPHWIFLTVLLYTDLSEIPSHDPQPIPADAYQKLIIRKPPQTNRDCRTTEQFRERHPRLFYLLKRQLIPAFFFLSRNFLDLVPNNLISLKIKIKTSSVSLIDCRTLRLICVIHNAEFSVLHIRVNFNIKVCAEPLVNVPFIV